MHTTVIVGLLFCLAAAYASALPAASVDNDDVKEVAPVAAIEGQELLQGEESRGHGGYHGGNQGGYRGGYQGGGYHGYHGGRRHYGHH